MNRRTTTGLGLVALVLMGLPLALVTGASSSLPYKAQGFDVLNAAWGAASTVEAGPGDINVPLTLALQYVYPFNVAVATEVVLSFSGTGFTGSDGGSNETAWHYGSLSPGQVFQLTYYLDLGSTMTLGFHSIPMKLLWTAILSNETGSPETYLYQDVVLNVRVSGSAHLAYQVSSTELVPGKVNAVNVTLTDTGTVAASDITTTVSTPQGVGLASQFPVVPSLQPGSSYHTTLEVFVANSTAGQPEELAFAATYVDSYGVTGSASNKIGFVVQAIASKSADTSLTVTPLSDSVVGGTSTKVSFVVRNIGGSTIYAPTFTLGVTGPLVIEENSTFSEIGTSMAPGASQVFTTIVTASPGATSGIYQATLQVSYRDQFGASHTGSYGVAIRLSGLIELVIQSLSTSQNATAITVTGNILDEGSSPAYYSSVTGYLDTPKASGSTDYVGEVDVNSPVPFSMSIPYQAGSHESRGNLTLLVGYKDSLGEPSSTPSSSSVQLRSVGELQPTRSNTLPPVQGGPDLLELSLIGAAVIVVAGAAVVVVARRRRRGSRNAEPTEGGAGQIS